MTPPTPRSGAPIRTTALLDDLLTNTLDPGYRAAAARPGRRNRWWDGPMVWLGCLAVGLLLVTAYQQSHRSAPATQSAREDLVNRIHALQSDGTTMDAEAKALAAQVAALRDAKLPPVDSRNLRILEIASGSVAVKGPGLQVVVGEPPQPQASAGAGRAGTGSQPQTAVLKDRDIRGIVNELWSAGAEAVAVNGIRLTATTAIRFAGESILVDFQTISSPYTVSAIGDRSALQLSFADSPIARQLKTAQAFYGITFTFNGRSELRLPSVTVAQQNYASPGVGPSATADTTHPTGPSSPAGTSTGSGGSPSVPPSNASTATSTPTPTSTETRP